MAFLKFFNTSDVFTMYILMIRNKTKLKVKLAMRNSLKRGKKTNNRLGQIFENHIPDKGLVFFTRAVLFKINP